MIKKILIITVLMSLFLISSVVAEEGLVNLTYSPLAGEVGTGYGIEGQYSFSKLFYNFVSFDKLTKEARHHAAESGLNINTLGVGVGIKIGYLYAQIGGYYFEMADTVADRPERSISEDSIVSRELIFENVDPTFGGETGLRFVTELSDKWSITGLIGYRYLHSNLVANIKSEDIDLSSLRIGFGIVFQF
ncbi:MAG: hypothetical protein PVG65_05760 [Candidatus Thorarchaeota archaeon]|jgi:hypothetical protein